jgi:hypothetical protein
MDEIGDVQFGVSTACSRDLFPVCRGRPIWTLGCLRAGERVLGNYAQFVEYTAKLNWFLPRATIAALALIATAAETLFGILLIAGWKTRITALLSGVLLAMFALSMTMALGIKAPLNLSVFSAAGGALRRRIQIFPTAWMSCFGDAILWGDVCKYYRTRAD